MLLSLVILYRCKMQTVFEIFGVRRVASPCLHSAIEAFEHSDAGHARSAVNDKRKSRICME